jgi:hypothetical protein
MLKIFILSFCIIVMIVSCATKQVKHTDVYQPDTTEPEIIEEIEIDVPDERIRTILGMSYIIEEKLHTVDYYGTIYRWYHLNLLGQTLDVTRFHRITVAEIFGTDTGDVLFVIHDDDEEYLYIDLGEARGQRGYAIFKLPR